MKKIIMVFVLVMLVASPIMAKQLRSLGAKFSGKKTFILHDGAMFGGCIVSSGGSLATIKVVDSTGYVIIDLSEYSPGGILGPIETMSNEITCTVSGTDVTAQFFEYMP